MKRTQRAQSNEVSRRQRHALIEPLEKRQLLHAVLDLRLPDGGSTATVANVGDQVKFDIWFTVTGHDTDLTNEGLQTVNASLLSTNLIGGSVNGTITVDTIEAPFTANGSQTGSQVDLDGDGDLDVGSNNNANLEGFFLARSSSLTTTGGTTEGASRSWKVGTGTFTATTLLYGVSTNLVARTREHPFAYTYQEDAVPLQPHNGGVPVAGSGIEIKRSPGQASVQGRVFNDKNANGIFDGSDDGISGFRVFLDEDFDGILDEGEISKPVSTAGTYTFHGVESGIYRVRQVYRDGWRQTNPGTGFHEVTLGYDTALRTRSFANTDTILIKGKVWMDANKNRFIDNLEDGMPQWMLFIDHNKSGVLDKGDDWTVTDAKGNYRFDRLPGGNYHVYVTQHPRYQQLTPASVFHDITLADGGTTSKKNFGLKRLK